MANENIINIDDGSFEQEVLKADQPVLVDFWATWCGPCKRIAPFVEQLADEYAGKARVGKLDVQNNPSVAARYNVTSIPVLMVFKNGEPVDQLLGAHPKGSIEAMLQKHI